jgi:serine/threonine-protein kinase
VLFEMLTGRRLFTGETVSDMVASVLRQDIDWTLLPAETPDAIRRLLRRCLDRDVKKRLQAIGEARLILEEVTAGPAIARLTSGHLLHLRRGWWLTATGILVAAAAIALFVWPRGRSGSDVTTPVARKAQSIAVLPFINGSGSADDEYVADGITDELIAGLGKVPGLHVAARSSVFAFKGQKTDVREMAKRLGVETILEGTVRRSGKRLRVTASLVSAADGLQLWSSSFQNDGGDTFAVQDEVTRGVVSGLALQLGGTALAASQAGRTKDPEAHDLYLRGLSNMNPASEADLRRALQFYQQALARDPGFALAYAGTAWVHWWLADGYVPPNEANPKARAAAQAALERDNLVADAHAVLAYVQSLYEWNPGAAERGFRRALELDPNSANARVAFAFDRCFTGHTDEGLAQLDRAAQLDPLSPVPLYTREVCFYVARRFDEVIVANRKTREIDPKFWYIEAWAGAARRELGDYQGALKEYGEAEANTGGAPQYGLAITFARMGRLQEARELLRRLDERARTRYVSYWSRAAVRGSLGDMDETVTLLQRAIDTRESWMMSAGTLPELAALATRDPRARRILNQVDAIQRSAGGQAAAADVKR